MIAIQHLLSFAVILLLSFGVQGQRVEPANQACTIASLKYECADDSADEARLNAGCKDLHGIPAAKCYMEYLCAHYDQETVNNQKECIDVECPLAKHVPSLVYSEIDTAGKFEISQTTDEDEDEAPPAEETTPEGEDEAPEEPTDNEDANAEDVIHEEVTVEKADDKDETVSAEEAAPQKESGGDGGMGAFGIISIFLLLGGLGFALFFFRDKVVGFLAGSKTEQPDLNPAAGDIA